MRMETTMAIFTYLREIISSGKLTRVITKYVETIKTVTIMANAGHCANQCPAGPNASIAGMNTAQKNRSETKTDFLSIRQAGTGVVDWRIPVVYLRFIFLSLENTLSLHRNSSHFLKIK